MVSAKRRTTSTAIRVALGRTLAWASSGCGTPGSGGCRVILRSRLPGSVSSGWPSRIGSLAGIPKVAAGRSWYRSDLLIARRRTPRSGPRKTQAEVSLSPSRVDGRGDGASSARTAPQEQHGPHGSPRAPWSQPVGVNLRPPSATGGLTQAGAATTTPSGHTPCLATNHRQWRC